MEKLSEIWLVFLSSFDPLLCTQQDVSKCMPFGCVHVSVSGVEYRAVFLFLCSYEHLEVEAITAESAVKKTDRVNSNEADLSLGYYWVGFLEFQSNFPKCVWTDCM